MSETIDDITINYEEDGQLLVKELDKEILSKGAWSTIMFKYQEMDRSGEYGPEKFRIARFKKEHGQFRQKSKFNISNEKQAQQIVDALSNWLSNSGEQTGEAAS